MSNALHRVPWLTLCLLLAAALLPANAQQILPVPELTARVIDQTGTLTDAQRSAIEVRLADFEKQHGSQIAVLLVKTTAPEDIATYANRVASTWKLGRPGIGDGVVVVLAMQDRTVRIEVARALEGAITDAAAKRIIDEHMVPAFRAGDYNGGIVRAVTDLTGLIRGEALPAPKARSSDLGRAPALRDEPSAPGDLLGLLTSLLLFALLLLGIPALVGARLSQNLSRRFGLPGAAAGAAVIGALGGALGYIMILLVELTGIWPAVGAIIGALLAVALMLLVQRYLVPSFDYNSAVFGDGTGSGAGTGGWTESYSGSGRSGDHGGSSSGSGGFSSGGGGSYAGGGASGKW